MTMMRLVVLLSSLIPGSAVLAARSGGAIGAVVRANDHALVEPAADRFSSAIQIYPWSDGAIYRLFATPGQVSDIALQPGEALISVAAGDTARWIIGDTESGAGASRQKHILVKPTVIGLATNLLITTDRRAYHLSLLSTSRSAMSAMSWSYPADALLSLKGSPLPPSPIAADASIDINQLDFDYNISGDSPSWRPVRVFNDGRRTVIEFSKTLMTGSAPPIFLVDGEGRASLVNYRVQGHFYIVDRLFDSAELRLGEKKQTIVRITRNAAPSGKARS